MKKSIIAGAAIVAALGLVACTEEAKAADATIYGQAEVSIETTNGVADVVSDHILGVKASESFGEGKGGAFAVMEFGYNEEGANGDELNSRKAYVGLDLGAVEVTAGKQNNLKKSMVNGVDAFQGSSSFSVADAARATNTVAAKTEMSGVTLAAAAIVDGATDEDKMDAYEVGASVDVNGITLAAVYTKDVTTEADSTVVSAGVDIAGVSLVGAYEPDNAAGKTYTGVASIDMGANTLRGGYAYVDGADNTMIVEAAHNFTKNTSVFVNYGKPENSDATANFGIAMNF
jgi:predicted porin